MYHRAQMLLLPYWLHVIVIILKWPVTWLAKEPAWTTKIKLVIISIVITDLLTSQGFSPQNGYTALHAASDQGYTAVAKLLIKSQAKLEIKNNVSYKLLVVCMGMGGGYNRQNGKRGNGNE